MRELTSGTDLKCRECITEHVRGTGLEPGRERESSEWRWGDAAAGWCKHRGRSCRNGGCDRGEATAPLGASGRPTWGSGPRGLEGGGETGAALSQDGLMSKGDFSFLFSFQVNRAELLIRPSEATWTRRVLESSSRGRGLARVGTVMMTLKVLVAEV